MKSVSFVIVTYNSARIIWDHLQSIVSQDHSKDDIEIKIVDGGSVDSTIGIAKSFGAKIMFEKLGNHTFLF